MHHTLLLWHLDLRYFYWSFLRRGRHFPPRFPRLFYLSLIRRRFRGWLHTTFFSWLLSLNRLRNIGRFRNLSSRRCLPCRSCRRIRRRIRRRFLRRDALFCLFLNFLPLRFHLY